MVPRYIAKPLFYFQVVWSFFNIIALIIAIIVVFYTGGDDVFEDWTRADFFQSWVELCLSGYWVYYFFSKFKVEDEEMVGLLLLLNGIVTLPTIINYDKYGLFVVFVSIFELSVSIYFFKCYDFYNDEQIRDCSTFKKI